MCVLKNFYHTPKCRMWIYAYEINLKPWNQWNWIELLMIINPSYIYIIHRNITILDLIWLVLKISTFPVFSTQKTTMSFVSSLYHLFRSKHLKTHINNPIQLQTNLSLLTLRQGAIGFKHRRFGALNSSEPGSLISSNAFPPQRRIKSETCKPAKAEKRPRCMWKDAVELLMLGT